MAVNFNRASKYDGWLLLFMHTSWLMKRVLTAAAGVGELLLSIIRPTQCSGAGTQFLVCLVALPCVSHFHARPRCIQAAPEHVGLLHVLIHLCEMGNLAVIESSLEACDRLCAVAGDCGHLAHMPSHIYCLVGRWHDAVQANQRAIDADNRYVSLDPVKASREFYTLYRCVSLPTLDGTSRGCFACCCDCEITLFALFALRTTKNCPPAQRHACEYGRIPRVGACTT